MRVHAAPCAADARREAPTRPSVRVDVRRQHEQLPRHFLTIEVEMWITRCQRQKSNCLARRWGEHAQGLRFLSMEESWQDIAISDSDSFATTGGLKESIAEDLPEIAGAGATWSDFSAPKSGVRRMCSAPAIKAPEPYVSAGVTVLHGLVTERRKSMDAGASYKFLGTTPDMVQ
jgi:hypothetical protein